MFLTLLRARAAVLTLPGGNLGFYGDWEDVSNAVREKEKLKLDLIEAYANVTGEKLPLSTPEQEVVRKVNAVPLGKSKKYIEIAGLAEEMQLMIKKFESARQAEEDETVITMFFG